MGVAAVAAQNPMVLKIKPEVVLHAYNDFILASRVANPERLMVDIPEQGSEGQGILKQGNAPTGKDLGAPTQNQQSLQSISAVLGSSGRNGGISAPS